MLLLIMKLVYLCHKEGAGVNHIQEVSEPTRKRVLREEENSWWLKHLYSHYLTIIIFHL